MCAMILAPWPPCSPTQSSCSTPRAKSACTAGLRPSPSPTTPTWPGTHLTSATWSPTSCSTPPTWAWWCSRSRTGRWSTSSTSTPIPSNCGPAAARERRGNPLHQARTYRDHLKDALRHDRRLVAKDPAHHGNPKIPLHHGVVFPNICRSRVGRASRGRP